MHDLVFILNLSKVYNAGHYRHYYQVPLAKNILHLYDEITAHPLSNTVDNTEITRRIRLLSEYLEAGKYFPNYRGNKIKILIVSDVKPWNFPEGSRFSSFPFEKLRFIQNAFQKYIDNVALQNIQFQYYFLLNNNDIVYKELDKRRGYCKNPTSYPYFEHFAWLYANELIEEDDRELLWKRISSFFEKLPNLNEYKKKFDNKYKELFAEDSWQKQKTEVKEQFLKYFFSFFSTQNFLKKDDYFFYFTLALTQKVPRLKALDKFTIFLLETIEIFGLEDDEFKQLLTLSDSDKENVFDIEDVILNEDAKKTFLEKFFAIKEFEVMPRDDENNRKHSVKLLSRANAKHTFEYESKELNDFVNRHFRALFSLCTITKKNIGEIARKLMEMPFDEEERKVRKKLYDFSLDLDIKNDDSVNEQTKELTIKEIEEEKQKIKKELAQLTLKENNEEEEYYRKKRDFKKKMKEIQKELYEFGFMVPKPGAVTIYIFVILFLTYLFSSHFFSAPYLVSGIYSLGVMAIISFIGFCTWKDLMLRKIRKEIIRERKILYDAFDQYLERLEKEAGYILNGRVKQLNLNRLNGILKEYKEIRAKKELYRNYYEQMVESINQLYKDLNVEDNKAKIEEGDYSMPPNYDSRVVPIVSGYSIRVTHSNDKGKDKEVQTGLLGIIQEIKLRIS